MAMSTQRRFVIRPIGRDGRPGRPFATYHDEQNARAVIREMRASAEYDGYLLDLYDTETGRHLETLTERHS